MMMRIEDVREFVAALNSFSNPVWFDVKCDKSVRWPERGWKVTATPMIGRTIDETDKSKIEQFTHEEPMWLFAWVLRQLIHGSLHLRSSGD